MTEVLDKLSEKLSEKHIAEDLKVQTLKIIIRRQHELEEDIKYLKLRLVELENLIHKGGE